MKAYHDILKKIMTSEYSVKKATRTGVNTLSLTGVQFEHDMRKGFPLLTTKKMGIKSISAELEFFIKGLSDKKWLQDRGCHIWDEWANPQKVNEKLNFWIKDNRSRLYYPTKKEENEMRLKIQLEENDLGRIYGVQWRKWKTGYYVSENNNNSNHFVPVYFDQLKNVIERAKKDPLDRRLLVSAWRPDEFDQMALPPCHHSWQILSDGKYLDMVVSIRSWDIFLGGPYNIASYGLLLTLLGLELNLIPRKLVINGADVHLYENHFEQAKLQLSREPYDLPEIEILNFKNIFEWKYTDVKLHNYKCHEKIEAPIAV